MPKQSLIEIAKNYQDKRGRPTRKFSEAEEELCLAWLNNEIKVFQIQHALNLKSQSAAYNFLALCARQIFVSLKGEESK